MAEVMKTVGKIAAAGFVGAGLVTAGVVGKGYYDSKMATPTSGGPAIIPGLTPGATETSQAPGIQKPYEQLSLDEITTLQNEPISIDEIKLVQQSIPYVDASGTAHINNGFFMEFDKIPAEGGGYTFVPKDNHLRARLDWLSIHKPTGDKSGNWQNPGDFTYEATAGDPREYFKVLELWGPGSTQEGEWKTMMYPGQSVSAGADTKLAGSEWSYAAVLDQNGQPTSEGWTAADVQADILMSISRRANFTVIAPDVQGWVNGQPSTGFLTIQDAVNLKWLAPRVPMTPGPTTP